MNFKFIASAIVVGALTNPESTPAHADEACDTIGTAKGPCTTLSINYDNKGKLSDLDNLHKL